MFDQFRSLSVSFSVSLAEFFRFQFRYWMIHIHFYVLYTSISCTFAPHKSRTAADRLRNRIHSLPSSHRNVNQRLFFFFYLPDRYSHTHTHALAHARGMVPTLNDRQWKITGERSAPLQVRAFMNFSVLSANICRPICERRGKIARIFALHTRGSEERIMHRGNLSIFSRSFQENVFIPQMCTEQIL